MKLIYRFDGIVVERRERKKKLREMAKNRQHTSPSPNWLIM